MPGPNGLPGGMSAGGVAVTRFRQHGHAPRNRSSAAWRASPRDAREQHLDLLEQRQHERLQRFRVHRIACLGRHAQLASGRGPALDTPTVSHTDAEG